MTFDVTEDSITVLHCIDKAGNLKPAYTAFEDSFAEFCTNFGVTKTHVEGNNDKGTITFGFTPPLPDEDKYDAACEWWEAKEDL